MRDAGVTADLERRDHWMVLLSLILGVIALAGIGWTFENGSILTVDGLFLSLILLALCGILFLNAFLDIRRKKSAPAAQKSS